MDDADLTTMTQDAGRLAALGASGLVDAPRDPALDRLTDLICRALRVPVALISLVDRDRQFFASACGLPSPIDDARQTPLSHSFCQHVVTSGKPLVVPNAHDDALVADNLAVMELGVIAYAGVPIRDATGRVIGSLCAIDHRPREWSAEQLDRLGRLVQALSAGLA
jgi:GAF domain-containing protein